MPTNLVKTAKDEELWFRAKTQAEKEGQGGNYAYITSIFENMKGKSDSPKARRKGPPSKSKQSKNPKRPAKKAPSRSKGKVKLR